MALGRHRAEPPTASSGWNVSPDIPIWGAFITVCTFVSMFFLSGLSAATLLLSLVTAVVFSLVWWLSKATRHAQPAVTDAAASPSPADQPRLQDLTAPAPKTQIRSSQVEVDRPADPASRWIDTFGPPQTGQLPIQRYIAQTPPPKTVTVNDGSPDQSARQWSHSRA